jgi:tetratricopeptide (TPR) repeat protein
MGLKMNRVVAIVVIFSALCGGCSLGGGGGLKAKLAEGLDPSTDVVDQDCSYLYFLLGRNAELTGKLDDAREAYEKALVCDLHSAPIMRSLAGLLVNMGNKREAVTWMERVVDENPGDVSARSYLANLYLSTEQPDKAEAIYRDIIAKDEKAYDDRLYLGLFYARQKKFGEARDVLQALLKLNPDYAGAYPYLARIYTELGDKAKARETYEKGLALNWTPVLGFELASFLEKEGNVDEAIKAYRRILDDDEGNEVIRTKIISLLLKADRIPEVIKELEALRNYASEPLKVELNLARLLLDQKRYDEATTRLLAALELDPGFDEARILLGLAYNEQGKNEAAVKVLKEVVSASGQYEDATLMQVRMIGQAQGSKAAEDFLREKIGDAKSRRAIFYSALAGLVRERKDNSAAETLFEEAMALYPAESELYLEYAILQDELGGTAKALAAMQKLLAAKPDDPYALNYIGYTWADRGENLEQALDYVRRALAQKPEDGFVRDSLGWVLFKMGRFAEAVVELEKARAIEPDDPTVNEHLGDAYMKLGRARDALKTWAKALDSPKEEAEKQRLRQKMQDAGQ